MGELRSTQPLSAREGSEQMFGTVTVLVTDIVGSTRLLRRLGDRAYAEVLDGHCNEVREMVVGLGGHEIAHTGDGFIWGFASARRAARAAIAAVGERLTCASVRLRAGIHTGELLISEVSGPIGLALHEAVIIGNAAPADTVWASELTYSILATCGSYDFGDRQIIDIPKLGPTAVRVLDGVREAEPTRSLAAVN